MSQISKLARKRAIDSLQEELRAEKDEWNGETSEFISALISLKKGLNGRGDKNKGLPPSKITEEFSGQISSFLSETAHKGSRVFELANKIIGDQNQYASHKKNALEEFEMRLVASEKVNLSKEASWFGSRFYSGLKHRKNLDKVERLIRKRLLESCVKFKDDFKKFEDQLMDEDNPVAVPMAISSLTAILFTMIADLIPTFLMLKKVQLNKKDETGESSEKPTSSKEEIVLPITGLTKDQTKLISSLQENMIKVGVIVGHLRSILKDNNLKELNSVYDDFSKKFNLLLNLKDKVPAETDKIKTLLSESEILFGKLKSIFETSLGKKDNIDEYIELIKPSIAVVSSIETQQFLLYKEASNAVSRWFNKNLLSLKKSPLSKVKFDIINQSLDVRKAIDELMNHLEDGKSWPEEFAKRMRMIIGHSAILAEKVELVSKIYVSETRREPTTKELPAVVKNIIQSDFKKLQESKRRLEAYLGEL